MQTLLCVGLGSFAGGVLRYSCGRWVQHLGSFGSFPWHTFAINLGGCLLLGLLNGLFLRHDSLLHPDLRAALTVGLCGGFTTFSTFSQESVNLLRHGLWGAGLGYIALSLLLGLALFAAGLWLGQRCA